MLWALYTLGFDEEANDFFYFVADVVEAEEGHLQVMYGIGGESKLQEQKLGHLSGYDHARPVRIGNGAYDQQQHDVWGAVLDSIYLHTRSRDQLPDRLWPIVKRQVEAALAHWRDPPPTRRRRVAIAQAARPRGRSSLTNVSLRDCPSSRVPNRPWACQAMAGEQLPVTEGKARDTWLSVDADLLFGRTAPDDDGRLGDDPEISRRHAYISRGADGAAHDRGTGSANGTFVNGERIDTPLILELGDTVRVGKTVHRVTDSSGAVPDTSRPRRTHRRLSSPAPARDGCRAAGHRRSGAGSPPQPGRRAGDRTGGERRVAAERRSHALAPPCSRRSRRERPADDRRTSVGEPDLRERRARARPPGARSRERGAERLDDPAGDRGRVGARPSVNSLSWPRPPRPTHRRPRLPHRERVPGRSSAPVRRRPSWTSRLLSGPPARRRHRCRRVPGPAAPTRCGGPSRSPGCRIVAVGMVAAQAGRRGVQELSEEQSTAHVAARILDVSDEAATRVFVEEIQEAIGPIDVLFAHVGVSTGGGPGTPDELRVRQWRINVVSHVYAAHVLRTGWIERVEGHLVTTASMAGLLSALGDAAYSATKRAAVGVRRSVGVHMRRTGVRERALLVGGTLSVTWAHGAMTCVSAVLPLPA